MATDPSPPDRRPLYVLAVAFAALAPTAVYARLGTVALLIATLIAQPCFDGTMRSLRRTTHAPLAWTGAAFFAWAMATTAWTPRADILSGIVDVLRIAVLPVMGVLLFAVVRDLPQTQKDILARVAMWSGVAMLALLALEVFSDGTLLALAVPTPPGIAPGQTPPVIEAAARGTAVIAPLAFIYAYLIYARSGARSGRWILSALFVAAVLVVCKASTMDAAWVAVVAGCAAFAVALIAPRVALAGFFGALILYAIFAPVISASILTLDGVTNLDDRAWTGTYARIGIWQEAARLIAQHPVIGHGFDSTRVLALQAGLIPGTPWPALPLHTHNAVLQIWLELGGIGAALLIAVLAAGARALWPLAARPLHLALVLATLAATGLITLVSFGIWQYWWWATWMLAGGMALLALRAAPARAVPTGTPPAVTPG